MARRRRRKYYNSFKIFLIIFLIGQVIWYYYGNEILAFIDEINVSVNKSYAIPDIPDYEGNAYIIINDNEPNFSDAYLEEISLEKYSNLDYLGRCGEAIAKVGIETMPTSSRGSIGMIKPSGWHTIKYDLVDGKYLYNRCHLIGYQLTGENANEKNLITCTRQMNTGAMLDFENEVAKYIKETKNHVLYRATPIFKEDNLIATGVNLEALSVEDDGEGIRFNVFIYNVQDGIEIDYKTGDSKLKDIENNSSNWR